MKHTFPYRYLFDKKVRQAALNVFAHAEKTEKDFGYQDFFEDKYTSRFVEYMGGVGYADAVCSGSVAVYLAIKACELKEGGEVILSPVTDPGCVSAVIKSGYKPVIADASKGMFNTDLEQIAKVISKETVAVILTHSGGLPAPVDDISEFCKSNNIVLIEDCSQAHGTALEERKVGTYGKVAAFSTMFSKAHATGGCGGLVYTEDEKIYWKIREMSDRGKCFNHPNFNPKDPGTFLGPGLNFNQDEISCAIGIETLSRLDDTIKRRRDIVNHIEKSLSGSEIFFALKPLEYTKPFYFFYTIFISDKLRKKDKIFLKKMIAESDLPTNTDYRYVVAEWPWMKKYLKKGNNTLNASFFRQNSFNILFNENFRTEDCDYITDKLLAFERKICS